LDKAPFSAITVVQTIIDHALALQASDVHLEPTAHGLRVRYRCNGLLHDAQSVAVEHALRVTTRIKVLAKLDIGEKRIPQDGKISFATATTSVDIRVATFPGSMGEKVVLRILDGARGIRTLEQLGCSEQISGTIAAVVRRSQGLFIVTGPTGSGKTTTLYAILSLLVAAEKNIVTLEDPVEYAIAGVTQGQIRPDIGFDFADGIRALLRQDPDIIMVGEIRDLATARAAVRAALTGHLVLTTLHTTDAVSSIARLVDMGIEPFLLNAVVTAVLAQRLIRLSCDRCKRESSYVNTSSFAITADELAQPGVAKNFESNGFDRMSKIRAEPADVVEESLSCEHCHDTGYRARTGIFELLCITPAIREAILAQASYEQIKALAQADGMKTLLEEASALLRDGRTTDQELARVL